MSTGVGIGKPGRNRLGIGIGHKLHPPGPTAPRGYLADNSGQPPAVGDRAVQQPETIRVAPFGNRPPDQLQGGKRLGHLAIVAVHAGHVPITTVTADENHAPGQGRFDGGQNIVAVDVQNIIRWCVLAGNLLRLPPLMLPFRTARASNGRPLPRQQTEAVADELQRRIQRILTAQKPIQIVGRTPQLRQRIIRKQPVILGMRASMCSAVGHGWAFYCVAGTTRTIVG